jgi:uncharacterized protein YjbI with pentapeptide repeats
MVDRAQQPNNGASPPLAASAIVLILFYIVVTVAGHVDTDLIRPDTQVSLQAASEKVNLPSGWVLSPFLGLKLPIFWFYVLAPVIVLALHVELLRLRAIPGDVWNKALRVFGNLLVPLALFSLLWNFAPYAHARPPELPGFSASLLISYYLWAALLADAALLLYPYLDPYFSDAVGASNASTSQARRSLGRIGGALLALRNAALLCLMAFALSTAGEVAVRWNAPGPSRALGVAPTTLIFLAAALVWAISMLLQTIHAKSITIRKATLQEAIPMSIKAILLSVLLFGITLADFGRPLNLVGARLAAAEPSEAVVAAMIMKTREPGDARRQAWQQFGRGLNYTRWQFASASFDGAVMPLIRLDQADLTDASLIRADLTDASLVGTRLRRAKLDDADLRGADFTCANNPSCVRMAQAPQAPRTAPETPPPQTGTSGETPSGREVCLKGASGGPSLNNARFADATIDNADLKGASLQGAQLEGLKDNTIKRRSNLSGADLKGANLKGVIFDNTTLTNACLCGADLTGADLSTATLTGADLRGAQLAKAKLPPELKNIDFEGANIKGTIFTAKQPDGPHLEGARVVGVVQSDPFSRTCPANTTGAP